MKISQLTEPELGNHRRKSQVIEGMILISYFFTTGNKKYPMGPNCNRKSFFSVVEILNTLKNKILKKNCYNLSFRKLEKVLKYGIK